MPSSSRIGIAVAFAPLLAAGCIGSPASPKDCQSSAQCPSNARCTSGACVANTPPNASVALPSGALEATRLVAFDGSASRETDPGDAIASYGWAFRAVSATCDPPAVAGTGSSAAVRFPCAGRFAVDLAVADELGATGSVTREFEVSEYSGPELITMGRDVVLDHHCEAGHCTTTGAVAISARLTSAAPAGLTLQWKVVPPAGLALGARRTVTLEPSASAGEWNVAIETTAGEAISGDWVFRAEAYDATGVVAAGATRVSVKNTPPVLTLRAALDPASHTFQDGHFVAKGGIAYSVTDPDGDPLLAPALEARHAGDGPGATFTASLDSAGSAVRYDISVPYATRADALHLIGGAGLERTILFSISDPNGGTASASWPITVANRPPTLRSTSAPTVDHAFDLAASAYVATAAVSTWEDPDGDPLFQVPGASTYDPVCAEIQVVSGVALARCSVPFDGFGALSRLVGSHSVSVHLQDPWAPAGATSGSFSVTNRPPRIDTRAVETHTSCSWPGDCCRTSPIAPGERECVAWYGYWGAVTTTVAGRWIDDDGDPLDVTLAGAPETLCIGASCSMPVSFPGATNCTTSGSPPSPTFATAASDGGYYVSGTIPLALICP